MKQLKKYWLSIVLTTASVFVLAVVKLTGTLDISWVVVLMPIWLPLAMSFVMAVIYGFILGESVKGGRD